MPMARAGLLAAALVLLLQLSLGQQELAAAASHSHSWEATVLSGAVRVQALSPQLLRVEPVGPAGFEDRPTFMVTNRSALAGVPITLLNESRGEAFLASAHWVVRVLAGAGRRVCHPAQNRTQAQDAVSTDPDIPVDGGRGTVVGSAAACASLCQGAGVACVGFNFELVSGVCHLLSGWSGLVVNNASVHGTCGAQPDFVVIAADGSTVLFDSRAGPVEKDTPGHRNLLLWPSPLAQQAYALEDFPRFTVSPWGPTPPSAEDKAKMDPALLPTNGFDFRNNQAGDTYVFLLGDDLAGWHSARQEFNALSGPTPLLPSWAFGTWFTFWHSYDNAEATADILRWEKDELPLDVWGLDVSARHSLSPIGFWSS